jgi:hypothetical protein
VIKKAMLAMKAKLAKKQKNKNPNICHRVMLWEL